MQKPTRVQILTTVALVLGVGLFAMLAVVGAGVVTIGGCSGCHLEAEFAAATKASAHSSVECAACHSGSNPTARLSFAKTHTLGMLLPVRGVDPAAVAVESQQCLGCHETVFDGTVESAGLRISHASCAEGIECTECHSTTAHGAVVEWPRTTSMEMCLACHVEQSATTDCDECHAEKLPDDRVKSGIFAVTHGPDYRDTHGMGEMSSCAACHAPQKCVKCHGAGVPHGERFMAEHRGFANAGNARCTECHIEKFCSDCHGYEMPHPEDFLVNHAEKVAEDGETICRRCHADPDCDQCHEKHVHPTTLEQLRELGVPGAFGDSR